MLRKNIIWFCLLIGVMVTACSISYKFNGASIDYTKVKTISIKDFPNQAPLVYPPLSQEFTEASSTMSTVPVSEHFLRSFFQYPSDTSSDGQQ
mgnify:CR=1 FL=1